VSRLLRRCGASSTVSDPRLFRSGRAFAGLCLLVATLNLAACGGGGSGPGDVLFTDINPPQVDNLQLETTVGVAVSGQVTGRDVDGDTLAFFLTAAPQYGSVSGLPPGPGPMEAGSASGRFVYTPDPDFVGEDRFSFIANDGDWNSRHGAVAIEVRPDAFAGIIVETMTATALPGKEGDSQGGNLLPVIHALPEGGNALFVMDLTGQRDPVLAARSDHLGRISDSVIVPGSNSVVFRAGDGLYRWGRDDESLTAIELPLPKGARVLGPVRLSGDGRWLAIVAASADEAGLRLIAHDLESSVPAAEIDLGLDGPLWIRRVDAIHKGIEVEIHALAAPGKETIRLIMEHAANGRQAAVYARRNPGG
jgi:hypothetical protein